MSIDKIKLSAPKQQSLGLDHTTKAGGSPIDPIIRLPELKKILGVSRSTVYAWMDQKVLPKSVALGPRARGWKTSDIAAFLDSLTANGQDIAS